MPTKSDNNRFVQDGCNMSTCWPTINMGCTSGPICCDEPECETECTPVRARDAIKLCYDEISRWFKFGGCSGPIHYDFRRVAVTIARISTNDCGPTCCTSPSGLSPEGELLVTWPLQFKAATPGYYTLVFHIEGYPDTRYLLYKSWSGITLTGSRADKLRGCAPDEPMHTECMPYCAAPVSTIQDDYRAPAADCEGTCDGC